MTTKKIRVLIADDHQMVRAGLSTLLETFDDMQLVGEADSGAAAIDLCEQTHPDVILMDLVMPEMDGVTATRLVRSRYPQIKVIALTSYEDREMMAQVLQAGANGFLFKNTSIDELADAIRMVDGGTQVVAPAALSALMKQQSPDHSIAEPLTEREIEVLKLLVDGLNNQEIADAMVISLSTVKTHVSHIYGKMGATNRVEAAKIAIDRKLIK